MPSLIIHCHHTESNNRTLNFLLIAWSLFTTTLNLNLFCFITWNVDTLLCVHLVYFPTYISNDNICSIYFHQWKRQQKDGSWSKKEQHTNDGPPNLSQMSLSYYEKRSAAWLHFSGTRGVTMFIPDFTMCGKYITTLNIHISKYVLLRIPQGRFSKWLHVSNWAVNVGKDESW